MLAYSVAQRRREFSVRLALGAAPGDLRRMVIGDALRPVLPGVVIGAAVALVLSRVLRGLVFGVSAADPLSFAAAAALIVAMACIASWLPAHRATRTDPTMAIRGD
jgi:ABC-type antimicrobial peptide transport system permease subunit